MDSPEPAREATKAAPSKENGEPWRVLVVEDNPDAGDSLRFALELSGYEVRVAPDGNTALELAQKIKPNVVLCDIGLPGSMDGYAVAAAFRADPALTNTHLVALTGYGREQDQSRALKAGFELHLRKPTDIAALRRAIASLRGRR